MISFNLKIPTEDITDIESRENNEFVIINRIIHERFGALFIIESTEEEFTILKLKYGTNAWAR